MPADGEARERRMGVRAGLALVLAVLFAWLALEGGPPFWRSLTPQPEPGRGLAEGTRYEAGGVAMYLELLAWEGDDLAVIVCVEKTDPDREPLWRGRGWGDLHVRFWDDQGNKLPGETDREFSFPDRVLFEREVRVILPIVVCPPAEARSLVVNWDNTEWQTRSVAIPPRPGSLPRWAGELGR